MIDARAMRDAYLQRYAEHTEQLKQVCQRARVDLVQLSTDRPFADALHEYLSVRRRGR